VALPATTPVTTPVLLTDATSGAFDDHAIARPVSVLFMLSFSVAVSCCVAAIDTVAAAGLTVTVDTGASVTPTDAVPDFVSLVAVIVADPGLTPVTKPDALTVATPGALVPHVTTRPVNAAPVLSFGVAVSWTLPATRMAALAGATVTDATGTTVTVTADVPVFVSLVAVIVAAPAAMPVASPVALTLAFVVSLLDHVTTRPASGLPALSLGVAVSWSVPPASRLAGAGVTVTVETGTTVTVIADVPVFVSLVAVIVAEPGATAVTRPPLFTVATVGALLVQST
jgi:hypothetical protein